MDDPRLQIPPAFAIGLIVAVAAVLIATAVLWRVVRGVVEQGAGSEGSLQRVRWLMRAALFAAVVGLATAAVTAASAPAIDPSPSSAPAVPAENPWSLVWSDDFEGSAGTAPDPEYWTHETGGSGWGNDELQYYTDSPDNASLDGNGNLAITARRTAPDATELECWYGPCAFTSARLITAQKQEFTYGRFETRVRVPEGAGLWPAVWMLGSDFAEVGWPQTGEIDIMEFVGNSPNNVFGTIHGPGYSGGQAYSGDFALQNPVPDEWHVFTVEWTPENITWTIDGAVFHEADPTDVAPNEWVFDHPFFLLTNMAVGGNFGGDVGDDVTFPREFTVDYVRVYRHSSSTN
ncbi:family 16 glycosylhydrolase [Conyzicola sp.]|uniref:glycoside hydrolase family 16 protein n=1 Tax=Conyzicola sp. TaxID=1969404 RepID=UPI0039896951